jgi:hypothetical protein
VKGERTASYSPSRSVKTIDTAARISLRVAHLKRKPEFPVKTSGNLMVEIGVSGQNVGKLNFLAGGDLAGPLVTPSALDELRGRISLLRLDDSRSSHCISNALDSPSSMPIASPCFLTLPIPVTWPIRPRILRMPHAATS